MNRNRTDYEKKRTQINHVTTTRKTGDVAQLLLILTHSLLPDADASQVVPDPGAEDTRVPLLSQRLCPSKLLGTALQSILTTVAIGLKIKLYENGFYFYLNAFLCL